MEEDDSKKYLEGGGLTVGLIEPTYMIRSRDNEIRSLILLTT